MSQMLILVVDKKKNNAAEKIIEKRKGEWKGMQNIIVESINEEVWVDIKNKDSIFHSTHTECNKGVEFVCAALRPVKHRGRRAGERRHDALLARGPDAARTVVLHIEVMSYVKVW
jgi:hypothetical protein